MQWHALRAVSWASKAWNMRRCSATLWSITACSSAVSARLSSCLKRSADLRPSARQRLSFRWPVPRL